MHDVNDKCISSRNESTIVNDLTSDEKIKSSCHCTSTSCILMWISSFHSLHLIHQLICHAKITTILNISLLSGVVFLFIGYSLVFDCWYKETIEIKQSITDFAVLLIVSNLWYMIEICELEFALFMLILCVMLLCCVIYNQQDCCSNDSNSIAGKIKLWMQHKGALL